jgi:hypothetical protein
MQENIRLHKCRGDKKSIVIYLYILTRKRVNKVRMTQPLLETLSEWNGKLFNLLVR